MKSPNRRKSEVVIGGGLCSGTGRPPSMAAMWSPSGAVLSARSGLTYRSARGGRAFEDPRSSQECELEVRGQSSAQNPVHPVDKLDTGDARRLVLVLVRRSHTPLHSALRRRSRASRTGRHLWLVALTPRSYSDSEIVSMGIQAIHLLHEASSRSNDAAPTLLDANGKPLVRAP